ncbi:uroporphyrinogen-III synthase [Planococcus lenghuensis]|uniref:Uroporphyrinogen-III synthase n=1 Tax=Planococcus lenghuensis TaxID=2213202 RepID=A0A1Q2KXC6_9BACL|nr:uroporphyrinogen-III synthase [Planococcus lenghuensis]AQQ52875.1 hypothetical protein B0X71_07080 [Planococcus lenghuensis]
MTSTTDRPLQGDTIIFTGSSLPEEAVKLAASYGANVQYVPLIETVPTDEPAPDLHEYDWLIFTSASAVEAFHEQHARPKAKIAAVGSKTAAALEQAGYHVDFVPSVFAADAFIREFPEVAPDGRCLFIRGARAKDTIYQLPLAVDDWTVYDTAPCRGNAERLARMTDAIVIFASPSAVETYMEAGGQWRTIEAAAIGYVTEQAIKQAGGRVSAVPANHTYPDVIRTIVKGRVQND